MQPRQILVLYPFATSKAHFRWHNAHIVPHYPSTFSSHKWLIGMSLGISGVTLVTGGKLLPALHPLEAGVSHHALCLAWSPGFPLPLLQWARQGRTGRCHCPAPPLVTAQTQRLLLLTVTIQGSLHAFVWCFCFEFPTDTKKSLHLPPFWRHLLHCDSLWHSSVTHHQPELCISQPCSSQNRSEQPDARKRIMKLFCHICTGGLKADKLLSSWKWVPPARWRLEAAGTPPPELKSVKTGRLSPVSIIFYIQFQLPDQRLKQGSLK